jgi:hypothetical protein
MQKKSSIPNQLQKLTSIFLMLVLLWLTVSTPFVYEQMQVKKATEQKASMADAAEDDSVSNPSEEKTESGVPALSEYLHELQLLQHHFSIITTYYKCHPSDLYFAFHPELLSPPPEV